MISAWKGPSTAVLICLSLHVGLVSSVSAAYLPLCIGNWWEYQSPEYWERRSVEGTTQLWDTDVYVIGFDDAGPSGDTENFWTSEPAGDVYLWGFRIPSDGSGVIYNPPIRLIDAPLELGKVWASVADAWLLPDTTYLGTIEVALEVLEEGFIDVPAGSFYAFGIHYTVTGGDGILPLEDRSLSGLEDGGLLGRQPRIWWSEGVGEIQYLGYAGQEFQLAGYDLPTGSSATTWGSIKMEYSGPGPQ